MLLLGNYWFDQPKTLAAAASSRGHSVDMPVEPLCGETLLAKLSSCNAPIVGAVISVRMTASVSAVLPLHQPALHTSYCQQVAHCCCCLYMNLGPGRRSHT